MAIVGAESLGSVDFFFGIYPAARNLNLVAGSLLQEHIYLS